MKDSILRLFDVPYFIQQRFGDEHPVFIHCDSQGIVTTNSVQYIQKSYSFCSFLLHRGLRKGNRVISIIGNTPEYNFTETGILNAGGVHIPLSALYNSKQLKTIFEIIRPEFVVTSSGSLLSRLRSIALELSLTPIFINLKSEPVFDYQYLEKGVESSRVNVYPDDIAVILFTSGSTGNPKGVILSHRNILESVKEFSQADIFHECKRSISFLQLSQSGERKVNYSCQLNGTTICYPQSSKNLRDNIAFYEADLTALVPYLLNDLNLQLKEQYNLHPGLRKIICGGASVPVALINSFENFGIKVFEVYGLTETASLLSYNTLENFKSGTVGKVARSMQLAFSGAGEILTKGDNIMQGYLLKDNSIERARDEEGWFHTGDVGAIDEEGFLKITGRIKNAFKNSRGSYVYPEEIEQELMLDSIFGQVIILGENADSLVAVLKLKSNIPLNGNLNHKINQIIREFNKDKNDDLTIIKYLILDNTYPESLNFVSMKTDRYKMAERIKSDSLINFISVE